MVSDQAGGNPEIAKAYIREMLDLNPMWQSETILRRRRELWLGDVEQTQSLRPATTTGHSSLDSRPNDQLADRRRAEKAARCLEKLENEFYALPEEKLFQLIDFLHHERLPEFHTKAKRLRLVAEHRSTLITVEEQTGDKKFAYSLMHSLVRPASLAGSLKEQYIEAIISEKRVKQSCRMVRQFVDAHPSIYALQPDWFDLILDRNNQKHWKVQSSHFGRRATSRQNKVILSGMLIALLLVIPIVSLPNSSRRTPSTSPKSPIVVRPQREELSHEELMNHTRDLLNRMDAKNIPSPQSGGSVPGEQAASSDPFQLLDSRPSWPKEKAAGSNENVGQPNSDNGGEPNSYDGGEPSTSEEASSRFPSRPIDQGRSSPQDAIQAPTQPWPISSKIVDPTESSPTRPESFDPSDPTSPLRPNDLPSLRPILPEGMR